jgi:cell division protein FtsQ
MLKLWLTSRWQHTGFLNGVAGLLLGLALCIAGLAGVQWLKRHSVFTVKEVVVTGLRGELDLSHQNPIFIRQGILRQLSGNVMTADLTQVQQAFAQAPWIRHVNVRRVWPNRLWVVLEEHQAVANLNEDYLVNQQGEPYIAVVDGSANDLPTFTGDKQAAAAMLHRYRELNQWLAPSKVTVSQLYLSERRAWTAVLSNRMTLDIGRDDLQPSAKERVSRWSSTWLTAQQAARSLGVSGSTHIDLRYPNGYAINRSAS